MIYIFVKVTIVIHNRLFGYNEKFAIHQWAFLLSLEVDIGFRLKLLNKKIFNEKNLPAKWVRKSPLLPMCLGWVLAWEGKNFDYSSSKSPIGRLLLGQQKLSSAELFKRRYFSRKSEQLTKVSNVQVPVAGKNGKWIRKFLARVKWRDK